MTKNNKKLSGFKKHVQIEALVNEDVAEMQDMREAYAPNSRSSRSKTSEPMFVENVGAVSIFSIKDLQHTYKNAELIFGDDRKKQAQSLLVDSAKNGNRRNLAGSPTQEDIATLRLSFPNFSEAIDQIEYASALSQLSGQDWFQMNPLLLLGPAGIGKTAFAQAFSRILNVNFKRLDVSTMSTAALISGLSLGWATGHTGEICKLICMSEFANPLLLLDEVDKVSGHHTSPIEPTLLSLLEPESSGNFKDEALELSFNCRHILYMATGNDVRNMSSPLLSRFTVVNVREPNKDEAPKVITNIYKSILTNNPWGRRFTENLPENVLDYLSNFKPRQVSSLLRAALGRAAMRGSLAVSLPDFPEVKIKSAVRMGFLK